MISLPLSIDIGVIDFQLFLVGALFNVLSPGPSSLVVVTNTVEQSWQEGMKTILGIMLGNFLVLVVVSLGLGFLFTSSPWLIRILLYMGSGFLIWIGLSSIKNGLKSWSHNIKRNNALSTQNRESPSAIWHCFIEGLLVAITNPIAILFYIAFFPKFIDNNFHNPHLSFSILSTVQLDIHFQYLLLLLLLGYLITTRLSIASWIQAHHHWVSALEILIGLVLIAYGCRLFFIS